MNGGSAATGLDGAALPTAWTIAAVVAAAAEARQRLSETRQTFGRQAMYVLAHGVSNAGR